MERNVLELLDDYPRGLKPEQVKKLIYQLLCAIDCCHKHNVIHRDIKPENLLVNNNFILKLCDFGFARQITNKTKTLTDYVATRWYRAPELLLGSTNYSFPVDMWAIGCIMGELITGEPLFPGESEIDQLYIIQKIIGRLTSQQMELFLRNPRFAGLRFPDLMKPETIEKKFIGKITRSALSFMEGVLQMNPDDRLTSSEALSHPYFNSVRDEDDYYSNKKERRMQEETKESIPPIERAPTRNSKENEKGNKKRRSFVHPVPTNSRHFVPSPPKPITRPPSESVDYSNAFSEEKKSYEPSPPDYRPTYQMTSIKSITQNKKDYYKRNSDKKIDDSNKYKYKSFLNEPPPSILPPTSTKSKKYDYSNDYKYYGNIKQTKNESKIEYSPGNLPTLRTLNPLYNSYKYSHYGK